MNKIHTIIPLMFVSIAAFAQSKDMDEYDKHVFCGDGRAILQSLKSQHNEVPTVLAVGDDSNVVMVVNHDTGTWTALETHGQKIMCILNTGKGFKLSDTLFESK